MIYTTQRDGETVTDQMLRDHFTGRADNEDLMVLSVSLAAFMMVAVLIASMAPVVGAVLVGLIALAYAALVVVPTAINVIVWVCKLIAGR